MPYSYLNRLAAGVLIALVACEAPVAVSPSINASLNIPVGLGRAEVVSASTFSMRVGDSHTLELAPSLRRSRNIDWTSSSTNVAAVNASGTVRAYRVGSAVITASGAGVVHQFSVLVEAPALEPTVLVLSLSPTSSVILAPGETRQYTATAYWSDGASRPVNVTYSASGGTITSDGLYMAGTVAGSYAVFATCICGLIASRTIEIRGDAAQLQRLTVSPKTAILAPGGTQQFAVTANWATGSTDLPPVTWSASGGTVSASGGYVAPSIPGVYHVIVAHSGGSVRDTASVTVADDSQSTSNGKPSETHRPSTYVLLSDNKMSISTPPVGILHSSSSGVSNGPQWWYWVEKVGALVADAGTSGPISPASSLKITYPRGLAPGHRPDAAFGFTSSVRDGYEGWYENGAFKIGDSAGFETQAVGIKALGFWGVGSTLIDKNSAELYGFIDGMGTTGVMTSWSPWFGQQSPGASGRRLSQNRNLSKRIEAGRWHQYELLMGVNTVGQANGTLRFWLDGVLLCEYTDVVWVTADRPVKFYGRKIDPIWGGVGGASKSREDAIWWDHISVSIPH